MNNLLKRNELINLVDSNKVYSKTMSETEVKELLGFLKNELSKYDYENDNNFIMNTRRKDLMQRIVEDNDILESLFNLFEFICDEYSGNLLSISSELGINVADIEKMDREYREKGIISLEEKNIIIKLIETILSK